MIRDGGGRRASARAKVRGGINEIWKKRRQLPIRRHSFFNFFTNPTMRKYGRPPSMPRTCRSNGSKPTSERLLDKMRLAMLVYGIDLKSWRGGMCLPIHRPTSI